MNVPFGSKEMKKRKKDNRGELFPYAKPTRVHSSTTTGYNMGQSRHQHTLWRRKAKRASALQLRAIGSVCFASQLFVRSSRLACTPVAYVGGLQWSLPPQGRLLHGGLHLSFLSSLSFSFILYMFASSTTSIYSSVSSSHCSCN